jgi:RHS repeat-associated protein
VEVTAGWPSSDDGARFRSTVFFGDRMVYARVDDSLDPGALQEGYLHQDHLGSLDRVTSLGGVTGATGMSYDAYGKRRDPDSWANDDLDAKFGEAQWLERGYTGHQHLDVVRLIHMNGRVQNPIWGRMLSPDPVVGDLTRPQGLNAYSYAGNNPLTMVDPTGYASTCETNPTCTVYYFEPSGGYEKVRITWNEPGDSTVYTGYQYDRIPFAKPTDGSGFSESGPRGIWGPGNTDLIDRVVNLEPDTVGPGPKPPTQSQKPDQKRPEFKLTPRQQCLGDRYGVFGDIAADLSYLSLAALGQEFLFGEVEEALDDVGTRRANQLLNSPQYYAGKRMRNFVGALKFAGKASGVVGAFATGFQLGMEAQCQWLEN